MGFIRSNSRLKTRSFGNDYVLKQSNQIGFEKHSFVAVFLKLSMSECPRRRNTGGGDLSQ